MDETWETLARRMVDEQIRKRGVNDPRVLAAIAQIPRHRFLPPAPGIVPGTPGIAPGASGASGGLGESYADQACDIGLGQTISQPYMVAVMTELLDVQPGQKVLEVGTGSGYQTAVLARMGARVVSVERSAELARRAGAILAELGLAERVRIVVGDGTLGRADDAPFNRVLVTAGAPEIPGAYREQLADGGRIVIPLGPRDQQELFVFTRYGDKWVRRSVLGCRFVPLVGADGWAE